MTIIDRIKQLMAQENIPPRQIKPAIANICGVSYQAVNQWFSNEVANIRIEHLVAIARYLNVTVDWLVTGESSSAGALDPTRLPGDDYEMIHQYSAMDGTHDDYLSGHLRLESGLAFKKAWLEEMQVNAATLIVLSAPDSAMEPFIYKGDVLLIDLCDTTPRSGLAYALKRRIPDNSISVRRLIRPFTGGWIIRSDNPDRRLFPDEVISDEPDSYLPAILGRIVWRGGPTS